MNPGGARRLQRTRELPAAGEPGAGAWEGTSPAPTPISARTPPLQAGRQKLPLFRPPRADPAAGTPGYRPTPAQGSPLLGPAHAQGTAGCSLGSLHLPQPRATCQSDSIVLRGGCRLWRPRGGDGVPGVLRSSGFPNPGQGPLLSCPVPSCAHPGLVSECAGPGGRGHRPGARGFLLSGGLWLPGRGPVRCLALWDYPELSIQTALPRELPQHRTGSPRPPCPQELSQPPSPRIGGWGAGWAHARRSLRPTGQMVPRWGPDPSLRSPALTTFWSLPGQVAEVQIWQQV